MIHWAYKWARSRGGLNETYAHCTFARVSCTTLLTPAGPTDWTGFVQQPVSHCYCSTFLVPGAYVCLTDGSDLRPQHTVRAGKLRGEVAAGAAEDIEGTQVSPPTSNLVLACDLGTTF